MPKGCQRWCNNLKIAILTGGNLPGMTAIGVLRCIHVGAMGVFPWRSHVFTPNALSVAAQLKKGKNESEESYKIRMCRLPAHPFGR